MFGNPTALSTRSDQLTLPGTADASRFRDLLLAEAYEDTWRIVEVFSGSGTPFEIELAWSAGQGVGAKALVSVPQATRIGVYARSLRIRARNLSEQNNPVGVTVADGQAQTHNQWEVRGEVAPDAPVIVQIPPFARCARVDLADPSLTASTELWLVDGDNILRARVPADVQPHPGVLVGGAREVHVVSTGTTNFRLVFDLTL